MLYLYLSGMYQIKIVFFSLIILPEVTVINYHQVLKSIAWYHFFLVYYCLDSWFVFDSLSGTFYAVIKGK